MNQFLVYLRQHKRDRVQSVKYLESKVRAQLTHYAKHLIKLTVLYLQQHLEPSLHLSFFFQHLHLQSSFSLDARTLEACVLSSPLKLNLNKATQS